MRIKKFVAHSLKEATEEMKKELGPEAIVVSSRKMTRGGPFNFLGRDAFEVTGRSMILRRRHRTPTGAVRRPAGSRRHLEQSRAAVDEDNALAGLRRIAEQFGDRQADDVRAATGGRRRADAVGDVRTPQRHGRCEGHAEGDRGAAEVRSHAPDARHAAEGLRPVDPARCGRAPRRGHHSGGVQPRANQDQITNKSYLEKQLLAAIAGIIPTADAEKGAPQAHHV